MTKNLKVLSLLLLAAVLALVPAQPASAQTAVTATTLSTAMTASQNTVTLASATGVSAQGTSGPITGIYVDKEFMRITTLVSGTTYNVQRAVAGRQVAHAASAVVYVGPLSNGPFAMATGAGVISGSCTRTSEVYLPRIYVADGAVMDCKSGQWIQVQDGTMVSSGTRIGNFCTGTVGSAETAYLNTAACSGATTETARILVSGPGTLANLRVWSSAVAVGGSGKDVLTVRVNGSDTAITCTIAAAASTCSDLTHSVNVVAGDRVSFKFVTATSDTAANVSASVGVF
jgi:hypothetical protein